MVILPVRQAPFRYAVDTPGMFIRWGQQHTGLDWALRVRGMVLGGMWYAFLAAS